MKLLYSNHLLLVDSFEGYVQIFLPDRQRRVLSNNRNREKMKQFGLYRLRFSRASLANPFFWFSLGRKSSYDSDYRLRPRVCPKINSHNVN